MKNLDVKIPQIPAAGNLRFLFTSGKQKEEFRNGAMMLIMNQHSNISGQIIAISHDLTPKGGLVREIPLFQGNLGWWNIKIWPQHMYILAEDS